MTTLEIINEVTGEIRTLLGIDGVATDSIQIERIDWLNKLADALSGAGDDGLAPPFMVVRRDDDNVDQDFEVFGKIVKNFRFTIFLIDAHANTVKTQVDEVLSSTQFTVVDATNIFPQQLLYVGGKLCKVASLSGETVTLSSAVSGILANNKVRSNSVSDLLVKGDLIIAHFGLAGACFTTFQLKEECSSDAGDNVLIHAMFNERNLAVGGVSISFSVVRYVGT